MNATAVKSELKKAINNIENARTAPAYKKAYPVLEALLESVEKEIATRREMIEAGKKAPCMNSLHDLHYEIESALKHYPERWIERKSYLSIRGTWAYKLACQNID